METKHLDIKTIKQKFITALTNVKNNDDLENVRITFLGRKGKISALMATLKSLPVEKKRVLGPQINELKQYITQAYEAKQKNLAGKKLQTTQSKEQYFDVTASIHQELKPTRHIYSQIIENLEDIFISMGYEVADGPEVETDYYNFGSLNVPHDHPAREEGDTFWMNIPNMLLRTQTSNVQARVMETRELPIAAFAPGRVYRKEATDQTHDFMFTQAEGLLIDKDISIAHLLATAKIFLQRIFDKKDLDIRVRPGFFPFVEPGLEIDGSCPFCKNGCSICKKTGWIELLGSGLVHPNVLRSSGIDPEKYSGFAFGFGIERIAMIRHAINDIRLFHSSKTSFLDQF